MKDLELRAKELRISIAEGKARLVKLDTKLSEAGIGTQKARPKSSPDLDVVRERVRKKKAQPACVGNISPTTFKSQHNKELAQLASVGIASNERLASGEAIGTDLTTSAEDHHTEDPAFRIEDEATSMKSQSWLKPQHNTVHRPDVDHEHSKRA